MQRALIVITLILFAAMIAAGGQMFADLVFALSLGIAWIWHWARSAHCFTC